MNIDGVNSIVSKKLQQDLLKVEFVNKYYWNRVKNHFYDFNPNPVNIDSICVIYPNKYHLKVQINRIIVMLRALKISKKYKEDSIKKNNYIQDLHKMLRGYLKIRKENKFTN